MRSKKNWNTSDTWRWKHNSIQFTGLCQISSKREVHSNTDLQEKQTNKHLNKLTYQLKELAKEKNNTTWTEEWNEDQRENKRSKKACSILRVKTDKNFPPDPQKREKTPKKRQMKGYITSTMKI